MGPNAHGTTVSGFGGLAHRSAAESTAHRIPHVGVSDHMALDQKIAKPNHIMCVRWERRRTILLISSER